MILFMVTALVKSATKSEKRVGFVLAEDFGQAANRAWDMIDNIERLYSVEAVLEEGDTADFSIGSLVIEMADYIEKQRQYDEERGLR
nr:MAG TPA: hypothetical protein [Caudoviricetes sp.]